VDRREVEFVCFGDAFAMRIRRNLYQIIGRTDSGRYLSVMVSPREAGEYYVVTSRNATEVERRLARRKGHL
jgi:hypothetical protein